MTRTKIEWCARPGTIPVSWSPITGCSKISEGCTHCYAERMARRLAGRYGYPEAPHHFDVTLHPDRLDQPLRWRKPRMVFVCSMGDLFHEDVPHDFIVAAFARIASALLSHTFIILTKRPRRMAEFIDGYQLQLQNRRNIWLGVTAENQAAADERIPLLLQIPAAVRFVSCEPLLGPINLRPYLETVVVDGVKFHKTWLDTDWLDWVIAGGESGPGARPMHPDWVRGIRDQCQAADVPFFLKQWGAWAPYIESNFVGEVTGHKVLLNGTLGEFGNGKTGIGMSRVGKKAAGHLLDGQDWHQWPEG